MLILWTSDGDHDGCRRASRFRYRSRRSGRRDPWLPAVRDDGDPHHAVASRLIRSTSSRLKPLGMPSMPIRHVASDTAAPSSSTCSLNERNHHPRADEQLGQRSLALFQRLRSQIRAVVLDQVEGPHESGSCPALGPQQLDRGHAVFPAHHDLAIDQERAHPSAAAASTIRG
jgi:hypothetical protein